MINLSVKIFLSVVLGTLVGYFFLPGTISSDMGIIIDIGLMILLFFVGIDIGKQKDILEKVKKIGFKVLLVPISVIIGSVIGGMVAGFLLKMPINEGGAVGSGLGWYTLSSTILLANDYVELSALAFLSNVFREVLGLVTIPLIAKYIGKLETVAVSGATAMDTSLPVISRSTNAETTIIAFVTGVICTASVPIILPLVLNFRF